jgi:hypothetical protein
MVRITADAEITKNNRRSFAALQDDKVMVGVEVEGAS